jgi:hypothetical protein
MRIYVEEQTKILLAKFTYAFNVIAVEVCYYAAVIMCLFEIFFTGYRCIFVKKRKEDNLFLALR